MGKACHLLELFSAGDYKSNYINAKTTHTCINCGDRVNGFRNAAVKLEYSISALCPNCQDNIYKTNITKKS